MTLKGGFSLVSPTLHHHLKSFEVTSKYHSPRVSCEKKRASIAIANLKNHLVVVPGAKQLSTSVNNDQGVM